MHRRIGLICVVFVVAYACASALSPYLKKSIMTFRSGNNTGDWIVGESWTATWSLIQQCLSLIGIAMFVYFWPCPQKGPSSEASVSMQLRRLVRNEKLDSRVLEDRDQMRFRRLAGILLNDRKVQFVSWWVAPFSVTSWNHLVTSGLERLNADLKSAINGVGNLENLTARCDQLATALMQHVQEMERIDAEDDMNFIIPNLYLGNYADSIDAWSLKGNKIQRIVRVGGQKELVQWEQTKRNIQYLGVVLWDYGEPMPDDVRDATIMTNVRETMAFLYKAVMMDRVPTLIHCFAGKVRSVTYLAAFLMTVASPEITVQDAIRLIRKKRPRIEPKAHFAAQLEQYRIQALLQTRIDILETYAQMQRIDFTQELAVP